MFTFLHFKMIKRIFTSSRFGDLRSSSMSKFFLVTSVLPNFSSGDKNCLLNQSNQIAVVCRGENAVVILAVVYRSVERVGGAHLRVIAPWQKALFEEKLQRWRSVGNTVFDLIGLRFEPQTSGSTNERAITAGLTFIKDFQLKCLK